MKRLTRILVAAALAALLSHSAEAADDLYPGYFMEKPAIPQFGGAFIGAVGGYTFGTAEFSSPFVPGIVVEDDLDGADGGIVFGYDLQNGSYFSGIELLGALGGPETTHTVGPFEVNYGIDAHVDARIRAGFLATEALALYAIGGGTYARTFVEASGGGLGRVEADEWRLGWLAGLGGEFLVSPQLSLGAEYTYTDLNSETYFGAITTDGHFNAVRAAARYRF